MPTYDASSAECFVYSFKEGVLSAIAHDLKHRVTQLSMEVDPEAGIIEARFDATSLRVECVMRNGAEAPGTLRDGHKREIQSNVVRDVLHARRYPQIRFHSSDVTREGDGFRIAGTLELHGIERNIQTVARRRGDRWVAEVEIHQPSYGIKPFSAMMGTLRIKPTVRVQLSVPA